MTCMRCMSPVCSVTSTETLSTSMSACRHHHVHVRGVHPERSGAVGGIRHGAHGGVDTICQHDAICDSESRGASPGSMGTRTMPVRVSVLLGENEFVCDSNHVCTLWGHSQAFSLYRQILIIDHHSGCNITQKVGGTDTQKKHKK